MDFKSILSVNQKKIRNKKVVEKFKITFSKIIIMVLVATIGMGVSLIVGEVALHNMYRQYYVADNLQGELRITIQAFSKNTLWALAASDDADVRADKLDSMTGNLSELKADVASFAEVYSDQDLIDSLNTHIDAVDANGETMTQMFNNGTAKTDIYAYYNDTMYPSIQLVVDDMKTTSQTTAANAQLAFVLSFAIIGTLSIISLLCVIASIIIIVNSRKILAESIVKPVKEVENAAKQMAAGETDITITYRSEDELGNLAKNMDETTTRIKNVVQDITDTLNRFAEGDFSKGTDNQEIYIGVYSKISDAFLDISDRLSTTLVNVKESSSQVSQGAQNMSEGASSLAEGATDQAAAIEELTASVDTVTEQTKNMAEVADQSTKMAREVQGNVETGAMKMKLVTDAMGRITDASKEIETITNTIESIAKQTQLLALNASIEAARAGEAGKGFAVVAEEIGELATQSNTAAKETYQLINDTMDEIKNGNDVVTETMEALRVVQESVDGVAQMMEESGEMARQQVGSMIEIDKGIEQISNVVQSNSATAQESSAVSQQLSEESEGLNVLIEKFRIK